MRHTFFYKIAAIFEYIFLGIVPKGIKYEYLECFMKYPVLFQLLCKMLFKRNIVRLHKKKVLNICYVVSSDVTWSGDRLFRKFLNDPLFEVSVIVIPITDKISYKRTCQYFIKKGFHIIPYLSWMKKSFEADIYIYSFPNRTGLKYADIFERPISSLITIVPYTFWYEEYSNHLLFDKDANVAWKYYCPTIIHRDIGMRVNMLGRYNMRYSGYPKLDVYYDKMKTQNAYDIHKGGKKLIIYAPGYYFVGFENGINYSTFDMNYRYMLFLAKKYSTDTFWVIRPHIQLGDTIVKAGVMNTISDYKEYLYEWSKLDNSIVNIGGDYSELFQSADAMITDSISFVSGFQYVHKPLLLLRRNEGVDVNEYGAKLIDILYKCSGDDYNSIEHFIVNVISDLDTKENIRNTFFTEYLDYKNINGLDASEYIYCDIKKGLQRK